MKLAPVHAGKGHPEPGGPVVPLASPGLQKRRRREEFADVFAKDRAIQLMTAATRMPKLIEHVSTWVDLQ